MFKYEPHGSRDGFGTYICFSESLSFIRLHPPYRFDTLHCTDVGETHNSHGLMSESERGRRPEVRVTEEAKVAGRQGYKGLRHFAYA